MNQLPKEDVVLIQQLLARVCEWLEEPNKLHMATAQLTLVARYLEDKAYVKD